MGVIGEKLARDLKVGDTIAVQNPSYPRGYSTHTIERIDRTFAPVDMLALYGTDLLDIVVYGETTVSLAGKSRNRWPHDHVPIAQRAYRRYPGVPDAADANRIFAWARSERKRRMSITA